MSDKKRVSHPAVVDPFALLTHFELEGRPASLLPYGSGHIHETFRVRMRAAAHPGYILQRVNTRVFPDVPRLMENIVRVTGHLRAKTRRGLPVLTVIPARDGRPYARDGNGGFWRCYRFIAHREPGARLRSRHLVPSAGTFRAGEAGRIFGGFIIQLSDLPAPPLHETIRGFHDIEVHLGRFGNLLHDDPMGRRKGIPAEVDFVRVRAAAMGRIRDLGRAGRLPRRVTHNDTKFNNILFGPRGGLCVIDLDTVMPGYVHYDFGDAVRSAANSAREDEPDLHRVRLDMAVFQEFARGYLAGLRGLLNAEEIAHLAFAARLMTYMVGLRFLNDHLDGDRYFKVDRPGHNLRRARVHFRLLEDMERRCAEMEEFVSTLAAGLIS